MDTCKGCGKLIKDPIRAIYVDGHWFCTVRCQVEWTDRDQSEDRAKA